MRKPLKVKLDLLEVENRSAQVSLGSMWIRGLWLGTKCRDSCWMDQSKEEFSFAPSVVRESAGWHESQIQVVRAVRQGRFRVLRHCVDNDWRQRRSARDKPLPGQCFFLRQ